jgi:hypothetical protein
LPPASGGAIVAAYAFVTTVKVQAAHMQYCAYCCSCESLPAPADTLDVVLNPLQVAFVATKQSIECAGVRSLTSDLALWN